MENVNKLAILIDGLLTEIANYGIASVKRIYGDWTKPDCKDGKMSYCNIPFSQYSNLLIRQERTPLTAQ